MLLKRHIRPALEELGITKRIGWHSFRHCLAVMLRQHGVDIMTAQELLRHANSRITLDVYSQAVSQQKRDAQEPVMRGHLGKVRFSTLKNPRKGVQLLDDRHKSLVFCGLWRGRRGSNPRPLP